MKCPRDFSELDSHVYSAGMMFDVCPICKGVLLSAGELESIEHSHDANALNNLSSMPEFWNQEIDKEAQNTFGKIKCPNCQTEMTVMEYGFTSRINIDSCPNCRTIWLDKGELKAIESFIEISRVSHYSQKGFMNKVRKLFKA
jgi:Zn-finger nucleic acid-binding protein